MAILHDAGKNRILNTLFGVQAVDAKLYIGLYLNADELEAADTMAAIEENSGRGYARQTLNRTGWTVVGNVVTSAIALFSATGTWEEVTGYFITTTLTGTTGVLIASEHFGAPISIVNGRGIIVTPKLTLT